MPQQAVLQGLLLVVLVVCFQIVVGKVDLQKDAKRRWQHALTGHALVQVSYFLPEYVCVALLLLGALAIWILKVFNSH